uniref:Period circadian protein homolog 2 n=1 Tax=Bos indicus x Bos taurus TaxID=30522 RepID=A0A4W2I4J4_BOBOX
MDGCADHTPSPSAPFKEPAEPWASQAALQEDVDMSGGSSGNETSENGSTGRDSQGSDCGDSGRELGLLVGPPGSLQGPETFGLMMAKSEHHLSTSGCSSEQSTKADAHKELIKTLKELKVHLPADRKAKGKASTLATLKYALRSVKQVKANEEYYQLLMSSENHPCSTHVPSYTVHEIEGITSEFIMKNVDMFVAAVSLVTGKTLYISDQVASIFHCKRDTFYNAKFVEFLAPHDVSVFHSSTTPYKLPPWSDRRQADSFTQECMEEKSFFCRVSVGKSHESEIHYHPFRMTPNLAQVCERQGAESQLCCVLLAERVHSGYEAPRIPPEKRIFTTTHSPNCLFQDVDQRAVPLLGYLPQDLIETPVLVQLHPSDRPLMLAIHKKIVQSGGQPFDYSPLRFRARNGEYITLDTSWSSFINPWSRKISFIIGRHRVRLGPLNEDVFSAPPGLEEKAPQPGVQELTEQIHRLLLQPVPHSGSSGYGSLGSNGSHEHLMSQTSSSDSAGQEDPRRRRAETCKNGNKAKSKSHYPDESGEQKSSPASEMQSSSPTPMKAAAAVEKDSSGASLPEATPPEELACRDPPAGSYQQISCLDSVIRYLESCSEAATLKRKCEFPASLPTPQASDKRQALAGPGPHATEAASPSPVKSRTDASARLLSPPLPGRAQSVASLGSQCSYSSTIVHVGDKKLPPELEPLGDAAASRPESLECPAGPALPCGLSQDQEAFRKLGLTKEVLAAHTQKEEQSFLLRFREIRKLHVFQSRCHHYLQERSKGHLSNRTAPGLRNTPGIDSSWKKNGKKPKTEVQTCQASRLLWQHRVWGAGAPAPPTGWPEHHGLVPVGHVTVQLPSDALPWPGASLLPALVSSPGNSDRTRDRGHRVRGCPHRPRGACGCPAVTPALPPAFFPGQLNFVSEMPPASQPEFFPDRTSTPKQPCPCAPAERGPPALRVATPGTPPLAAGPPDRTSPALFQSRGSSPLQLNLMQLEEAPEGTAAATGAVGTVGAGADCKPGSSWDWQPKSPPTCKEPADAPNSDALSSSSGLLRLLLHGDLCSATGSALSRSQASATSCSLGSGSLGCDASGSRPGSSHTSHTSRYFGSSDSSENNPGAAVRAAVGGPERLLRCVLQDPVWLLAADTDDSVRMTYQMPARDLDTVLQEDREKLKALQRLQPRFTDAQKQELQDVHPWMRLGGMPTAIDVAGCVYCENEGEDNLCVSYEEDIPTPGLSEVTETKEEESRPPRGPETNSRRNPLPQGSSAASEVR